MYFGNVHKHLARAAKKTLERIREDEARAPAPLRPALAYVRKHLFHPDLDVNALRRAVGARGEGFSARFAGAVGLTPKRYIRERRLETAKRLLRDTAMTVELAGNAVGYSVRTTFVRAFTDWAGQSPSAWRAQARARLAATSADDSGTVGVATVRRLVLGDASFEEAQEVLRHVLEVYERLRSAERPDLPPGAGLPVDPERAAELRAEAMWQTIRGLPADVRGTVASQPVFREPAVFERLRHESRMAGRGGDTAGRLAIAELAVLATGYDPDVVPADPAMAALQARAWAWMAIVCRQGENYLVAEEAVEWAQALRKAAAGDPLATGEVLDAEADLRLCQWRFDEALTLQQKAVARLDETDAPRALLPAMIQLGNIHFHRAECSQALIVYKQASDLLAVVEDTRLRFAIHAGTAASLVAMGRAAEGERELARVEKMATVLGDPTASASIAWQRAILARSTGRFDTAIEQFRTAIATYDSLGQDRYFVVATLDLALTHAETGERPAARSLVSRAARRLSKLPNADETAELHGLLQRALEREPRRRDIALEEVRTSLMASRFTLGLPPKR